METIKCTKFNLGRILITPGALAALSSAQVTGLPYLRRHATGDWGELSAEDIFENEESLKHGWRILSAYLLPDREKIWIITEADRSVTTILLPEDY